MTSVKFRIFSGVKHNVASSRLRSCDKAMFCLQHDLYFQCPPGRTIVNWDSLIFKYRKILIFKQNFTCFLDVQNTDKHSFTPIIDEIKYSSSFVFHMILWPVILVCLPIAFVTCFACCFIIFLLYDYYGPTIYDFYDNCRRKTLKRQKSFSLTI